MPSKAWLAFFRIERNTTLSVVDTLIKEKFNGVGVSEIYDSIYGGSSFFPNDGDDPSGAVELTTRIKEKNPPGEVWEKAEKVTLNFLLLPI